jgi:hypothetical protein
MSSVYFEAITSDELLEHIKTAFREDHALLNRFHISPGDLDHCAGHTYQTITGHGTDNLEFWKVQLRIQESDEVVGFRDIGFVVTLSIPFNILLSFGLNIGYRTGAIKRQWLQLIEGLFPHQEGLPKYVLTLHSKNIRTIDFFKKNGFSYKYNADKTISLWVL